MGDRTLSGIADTSKKFKIIQNKRSCDLAVTRTLIRVCRAEILAPPAFLKCDLIFFPMTNNYQAKCIILPAQYRIIIKEACIWLAPSCHILHFDNANTLFTTKLRFVCFLQNGRSIM